MLIRPLFLLSALFLILLATAALAEKRVALVIGNSAYKISALANPVNDANDIADVLTSLGFDVVKRTDASLESFQSASEEFRRRARGADVALVYYAGHAMQFDQQNWLMPLDTDLSSPIRLRYSNISLQVLMRDLEGLAPTTLVFLDACRTNVAVDQFYQAQKAQGRDYGALRGLQAPLERPSQTLLVFATKSGAVAADGSGRNSPFTTAFLQHVKTPGVEVESLMKSVKRSVRQTTGDLQQPEWLSGLENHFFFVQPEERKPPKPVVGTPAEPNAARQELASLPPSQLQSPNETPFVPPKPPVPPPPPTDAACPLELEPSTVDQDGVGHFVLRDKCGRLDQLSIDYAGMTFTLGASSRNRAEFTFDFFAGAGDIAIRTSDQRSVPFPRTDFDQNHLAKSVIMWDGADNLDLHAFEDSSEPGGAGHVWRGRPRSHNEAAKVGGGYMSQLGQTDVNGTHVQVYTLRHSGALKSVTFRVNQSQCAPNAPRIAFRMLRYQNGAQQKGASARIQPNQCGAFTGPDLNAWAPRANELALSIPF